MMQLNRAKFMVNGGIGYVLKPPPMCKGMSACVTKEVYYDHYLLL